VFWKPYWNETEEHFQKLRNTEIGFLILLDCCLQPLGCVTLYVILVGVTAPGEKWHLFFASHDLVDAVVTYNWHATAKWV